MSPPPARQHPRATPQAKCPTFPRPVTARGGTPRGAARLSLVGRRIPPRGGILGGILRAPNLLRLKGLPPPGEDSAIPPPKVAESSGQLMQDARAAMSGSRDQLDVLGRLVKAHH